MIGEPMPRWRYAGPSTEDQHPSPAPPAPLTVIGLPDGLSDSYVADLEANDAWSSGNRSYRPASASYCSMTAREMRPRGETSRPLRWAHSRMAWLCARSVVAGLRLPRADT